MYVILQSKIFTIEKTNVGIVFFNTIPPKKKKELAIAGKLFLFLCLFVEKVDSLNSMQ